MASNYDTSKPITCKYCGKTDLHWVNPRGSWFLVDNNGVGHTHPKGPKSAATQLVLDILKDQQETPDALRDGEVTIVTVAEGLDITYDQAAALVNRAVIAGTLRVVREIPCENGAAKVYEAIC